ncbi:MAG: amidase [Segniliparus sp.]|uniref:amidase n=1 Tax=Segniliparus sp. TaxID=2804064 RepID=UPI003F2BD69A
MALLHTFTDDALGDLDATALGERIRSREISALEAVEAAITRVEQADSALNAVEHADFARARERARALDRAHAPRSHEKPFEGVPTFVKDNVPVAGLPTTYGSAAFSPRPARASIAVADQYLAAGCIVLGKSTMPEFGLTASTEWTGRPPTANPWNTRYSTGASSGGSAALTAAGAVPLAHANDGGGSIRIPAAATGLVGLKPSVGRMLSQPGAELLPINIDAEGVVTRTVRDSARHYRAAELFRPSKRYPQIGLVEGPNSCRRRIGVLFETATGAPLSPAVEQAVRAAAEFFADEGHEVVEIPSPVPSSLSEDFIVYWEFFAFALSVNAKISSPRRFSWHKREPFTVEMAAKFGRHAHKVPTAIYRLRQAGHRMRAVFTRVDAILTPVLAHEIPRLGHLDPALGSAALMERLARYAAITPTQNITGQPAISLPFAVDGDGLPIGIQLAGDLGAERVLLELGYELEALRPFPRIQDVAVDAR